MVKSKDPAKRHQANLRRKQRKREAEASQAAQAQESNTSDAVAGPSRSAETDETVTQNVLTMVSRLEKATLSTGGLAAEDTVTKPVKQADLEKTRGEVQETDLDDPEQETASFAFFPGLPEELRCKIWNEALYEEAREGGYLPDVIVVESANSNEGPLMSYELITLMYNGSLRWESHWDAFPSRCNYIKDSCAEAARQFDKFLTPIKVRSRWEIQQTIEPPIPGLVWGQDHSPLYHIDFDTTLFVFEDTPWTDGLEILETRFFEQDLARIKQVCIKFRDNYSESGLANDPGDVALEKHCEVLARRCPKLRSVLFVHVSGFAIEEERDPRFLRSMAVFSDEHDEFVSHGYEKDESRYPFYWAKVTEA